ncbi:hypothetical protein EDB19DRAFT_1724415 [Suillus lakei]|nr:hypothetical protein EDB19DRAFT_1724415 [Suillus lakei]
MSVFDVDLTYKISRSTRRGIQPRQIYRKLPFNSTFILNSRFRRLLLTRLFPTLNLSLVQPTMHNIPLSDSKFTLDASGVAGFFGGDEAVSAMATVHVYQGRNGWDGTIHQDHTLSPRGMANSPTRVSGTVYSQASTPTLPRCSSWMVGRAQSLRVWSLGRLSQKHGHLASLMVKECQMERGIDVPGRKTQPVGVTIVDLHHVPDASMTPKQLTKYTSAFAFIPMSVSIGTCIACALFEDWYSFNMILLGMIASGVSCFVIGSGKFTFSHPIPAPGAPRGDGLLLTDNNVIVLLGEEGAVNSITRGRFSLNFGSEPEYRNIGVCSLILTTQFIAQLLLIPQAALFGQIMFVTSLAVSWAYNSWLSSLDKEEIQRRLLLDAVLKRPFMTKYMLGTRTTMAVFVLLALTPSDPAKVLDDILPNDTKVWKRWKSIILSRLQDGEKMHFQSADWDDGNFNGSESTLLKTLLGDAQAAYDGYSDHLKLH